MSRGGVNKVILIGNLGADPEVKYTPDGAPVANFNMATSESWTNKSGERQERTEWHRIVMWRKLAEIAGQYLRKGSKIYVEGKLKTRSWEDQSGQKRYMTEVEVNDMQMLDSRGDAGGGGGMQGGGMQGGGAQGGGMQGGEMQGGGAQGGGAQGGGAQGGGGGAPGPDYSQPVGQGDDDDLPF